MTPRDRHRGRAHEIASWYGGAEEARLEDAIADALAEAYLQGVEAGYQCVDADDLSRVLDEARAAEAKP